MEQEFLGMQRGMGDVVKEGSDKKKKNKAVYLK